MHRLSIPLVVLICGAAAVSCADDTSDTGTAAAATSDSDGGSCLEGMWECTLPDGSTAQMTIDADTIDGSFSMAGVSGSVMSTITVDGESLTVVDTGGTGACPPSQTGEYTFTCGDDALSFTQVSDDCIGRMNFFGCAWTRA